MITRLPICASVLAHSYYRKLGNVNAAPYKPDYTSDATKGYRCQCIFTAYRYNGG